MSIFFIVFVPLIFFIIAFLVKLIIEGTFKEEQLYLGIELALGNLSLTINYIYSVIKNTIDSYSLKTNISSSEVIDILKNIIFPLAFIVVIFAILIGIVCLHRLFESSTNIKVRRIMLLGISNSLGFILYFGYAFLFALK